MKIVVKVGGSVSMGDFGPDFSYFSRFARVIEGVRKNNQVVVAIGGGSVTRKYGKAIEKMPLSNAQREKIFIKLIEANVITLSYLTGMDHILSVDNIKPATSGVIGGVVPGRSTDANAVLAAKAIRADIFVKMTDVDGIYDKDPKKFSGAKLIEKMSFSDLRKFSTRGAPNNYGIMDSTAISTLSEAEIKTVIINGKKPENLLRVLHGERMGTVIE